MYVHWDVSPRVFPFLELPRWYGVLWAVGVVSVYLIMRYVYRTEERSTERFDTLTGYLLVGGLLGARLGHVFFYEPAYFLAHPIEILPISLQDGFRFTGFAGLASHGGTVGAIAGAVPLLPEVQRRFLLDPGSIVGGNPADGRLYPAGQPHEFRNHRHANGSPLGIYLCPDRSDTPSSGAVVRSPVRSVDFCFFVSSLVGASPTLCGLVRSSAGS